jgi:hypothetical protein
MHGISYCYTTKVHLDSLLLLLSVTLAAKVFSVTLAVKEFHRSVGEVKPTAETFRAIVGCGWRSWLSILPGQSRPTQDSLISIVISSPMGNVSDDSSRRWVA